MAAYADSRPLAVVAALYAISVVAYLQLPPFVNRGLIAFVLPSAAAVIYVVLRVLTPDRWERETERVSHDATKSIIWYVVLAVAALQATIFAAILGRGMLDRRGAIVPRLTPAILGVVFILVGNLLPRLRPNAAFGIRTAATLHDRSTWLRINRKAGYVAVALGSAILAVDALAPRGPLVAGAIRGAGLIAAISLVAIIRRNTGTAAETGHATRASGAASHLLPRIILSIVFAAAGAVKFSSQSFYVPIFQHIGLGAWLRYVTGIIEVGGAGLLLTHRLTGAGFFLLGCTMVGAIAYWIAGSNLFAAMVPGVLLLLIVWFGRRDVARLFWTRGR